jgi:NADH-quinone oxidoreductase subunit K
MPPIGHYLFLSFALMTIGVIGAVTRRNSIIRLFSVEVILSAASINLAAFARLFGDATGQLFAILIAVLIAAEILVAVAIFAAVFRRPPGPASAEQNLVTQNVQTS